MKEGYYILEVETTEGGCNIDYVQGPYTRKDALDRHYELDNLELTWNKVPRYNCDYFVVLVG